MPEAVAAVECTGALVLATLYCCARLSSNSSADQHVWKGSELSNFGSRGNSGALDENPASVVGVQTLTKRSDTASDTDYPGNGYQKQKECYLWQ